MGVTERPPRVRVHVGELVLPKLSSADPQRTADRVRSALSRLVGEGIATGRLRARRADLDRSRAGVQLPVSARSDAVGDAIARALYRTLSHG